MVNWNGNDRKGSGFQERKEKIGKMVMKLKVKEGGRTVRDKRKKPLKI